VDQNARHDLHGRRPAIGGLRTWPQTRTHHPDETPTISKIADLHNGFRKIVKNKPYTNNNSTNTAYNHILQNARLLGADRSIHSYSNSPYRARRDAIEVMWGGHIHICQRKHGPSLTCTKCQSPLTNTHIFGGCRFTSKFRTQRHNNTFTLLHQLLKNSDGGRWPILGVDLGQKSITDFKNIPPTTDDQF
jgi:hypothetical protein